MAPQHIVAVAALVYNTEGEALLVRTHHRSDTWEFPGGQVEEGEPLDKAVEREVFEETGVTAKPIGITGVYYNTTRHILSIMFRAEYVSGELTPQPEEIRDVRFVHLDETNIREYITRPNMLSRSLDAMHSQMTIPYESWQVGNYELLGRLEAQRLTEKD